MFDIVLRCWLSRVLMCACCVLMVCLSGSFSLSSVLFCVSVVFVLRVLCGYVVFVFLLSFGFDAVCLLSVCDLVCRGVSCCADLLLYVVVVASACWLRVMFSYLLFVNI